jgi:hypothetical protein
MDDDTRSREGSVSRRTMLKRIGAAGAVAWVTPVISSLTTPAYADGIGSLPGGRCSPPGNCQRGFTNCGTCGEIDGSFCFTTPTGAGFCGADSFCDEVQPCASGSCPAGFECAVGSGCDCLSVGPGVCLPVCTSGHAPIKGAVAQLTRHGLTATGKYL